jgi:phosphoribosylformylglycinamidine cyclo-ligase
VTVSRAAYERAGVDVAAGDRAVDLIRERLAGAVPTGLEIVGGVGGFGAAVALPAGYREPLLVSATDGVGTKTAIAAALGRFETIGQDLVAMCADDVVCHGARPLFFLDYLALGRVEPAAVAELVGGVVEGCRIAGCSLVGGETAEHPGLLPADGFDLAGCCVGIVERADYLDGSAARAGDAVIGMASSGLHANGFSLVRALIAEYGLDLTAPYLEVLARALDMAPGGLGDLADVGEPEHALATLGEVLLTPTRIYAVDVLALRDALAAAGTPVRGLAHITGGGLAGNLPRAVGETLGVRVELGSWPVPSIFPLIRSLAAMDGPESRATLNGGIGMAAVVPGEAADRALAVLGERGVPSWRIGEVVTPQSLRGARYAEVGG